MSFIRYKTFKGGRYAYISTESSLNGTIQIKLVKFLLLLYNISLGLEPCFCDLISRLWLHRDVTDPQQSSPYTYPFYVVKENRP